MFEDDKPEMPGSNSENLRRVLGLYNEHLPGVGKSAMLATLSSYVAHKLPGPPLWISLVGVASSGKTETLNSLRRLPDVFAMDNVTQAGLLSGSASSDRDEESTGGLLCEMGNSGIILCSDFTSTLSEHRETQDSVLSALRNIYDGRYTRRLGTDGGRTFEWKGKAGFIGGATPSIDQLNHLRVALGERFLYHWMSSDLSPIDLARVVLERASTQDETRAALYRAVRELLLNMRYPTCPLPVPPGIMDRLSCLAAHTVVARSGVLRDRDTLVGASPTESTPRLVQQLRKHYDSLILMGCSIEQAWDCTVKTGLDSCPAIRRKILESLRRRGTWATVNDIMSDWPFLIRRTIQRSLDEVKFLGLTEEEPGRGSRGSKWKLSDMTRSFLFKIHAPFTESDEDPESEIEDTPLPDGCTDEAEEIKDASHLDYAFSLGE